MAKTKKQARRLGLDRRYRDAPRFPVIIEYEEHFQKEFDKNMKFMMKDVEKKLYEFTKPEKKKT